MRKEVKEEVLGTEQAIEPTPEPIIEETPTPTAKERALSVLSKRKPDKQYGEEDDLMGDLIDVIEEDSQYRDKVNDVNQRLYDLFNAEPVLFNIVQDALRGAPGTVAVARNIEPEDYEAARSDESTGEWEENIIKRKASIEQSKKAKAEAEENLAQSIETASTFCRDKGMSEEETDEFLKVVDAALEPIYKGIVDRNYLENLYKAVNYDAALSEARALGEAKARNEKFVAEKETAGDGLPQISSSTVKEETKETPSYMDRFKKK